MRFYFMPILIAVVVTLAMAAYIWYDIRKSTVLVHLHKRVPHIFSNIYIGFAIMQIVLLIVALCSPVKDGEKSMLSTMWLLFTFLTIFMAQLVYTLVSLLGRIPQLFKRARVNTGLYAGLPLSLIVIFSFWNGALFTRFQIEKSRIDIASSKLPKTFDGYKIVQFSDAHLAGFGNDTTFISNLVDSINAENAHLILFTGDMVTRNSSEMPAFVSVLSRLKARDGVYSVMGNHDYGDYQVWPDTAAYMDNIAMFKRLNREAGITMLDNAHIYLHSGADSIALIGVENWGLPPFKQYGDLQKSLSTMLSGQRDTIPATTFRLLMSHDPAHWEAEILPSKGADLTLSGHTHAMQIAWKIFGHSVSPASWVHKYWGGLYKSPEEEEDMYLYVNIGSGETGLPARIGARPELTVITLRTDGQ